MKKRIQKNILKLQTSIMFNKNDMQNPTTQTISTISTAKQWQPQNTINRFHSPMQIYTNMCKYRKEKYWEADVQ